MLTDLNTVELLLPELLLVVLAAWVFIGGTFSQTRGTWIAISLASLGLVMIALYRQDANLWSKTSAADASYALSGPLFVDRFGHAVRWGAVVLAALFVMLAARGSEVLAGEYVGCAILAFLGLMLVGMGSDLVFLFLALELISIPTYVLLFLGRSARSSEATAKYFFLSILSSALMLYGFSFLYGITGAIGLEAMRASLADGGASEHVGLMPLALVMTFSGLGFKIAAAPFHFYAPDVYQGTTNANAGLLAVLPKAAGIIVLLRLSVAFAPALDDFAWQLVLIMSLISMTLGNVSALWQNDMRRMLAFSSIAHAGYMLIGLTISLAAGTMNTGVDGLTGMVFYLLVYAVSSFGAFAVLSYLSSDRHEVCLLEELSGLARRRPLPAALLTLFMFSLSGIPPLAGFWGKFTLFAGAIGFVTSGHPQASWFLVLAVVAALNAAIGAGYYLRVIGAICFGEPTAEAAATARPTGGLSQTKVIVGIPGLVCGMLVVLAGLMPNLFLETTAAACSSAHHRSSPSPILQQPVPGSLAPSLSSQARR